MNDRASHAWRPASAGALAIAAFTIGAAAQQPVFKAGVDAVRVDVLVTRGGKPVTGLTTADFELRDSGVPQQIDVLSLEEVPLHLLLALDTSSSLNGKPIEHLKAAARAAVASLRPDDRAALITFSHAVRKQIPWSAGTSAIRTAIDGVSAAGATSLSDAAFAALGLREGVEGRMLALLFSDGFDTASWLDPLAVIEQARRSDVVIDAVSLSTVPEAVTTFRRRPGVSPGDLRRWFLAEPYLFRTEFLAALADETGGEVVVANRSSDLQAVFVKIVADFKMRYVLTYSPNNVAPSGWHPIEVRLKNKKGDVRARRGYTR
jgi:VWFA-related protein